jgi:integrase/recombinase XerD
LTANVPLLEPAIALIKKYERKKSDLARLTIFPLVTNKDLNMNLKIISEICEIGIPLNFYIARHTFATTLTLSQGVPITTIKEMMGHEKIQSTLLYAKTNNSMIGRDMMLVQEKMDLVKKKYNLSRT